MRNKEDQDRINDRLELARAVETVRAQEKKESIYDKWPDLANEEGAEPYTDEDFQ
jgi:hypothetical protein